MRFMVNWPIKPRKKQPVKFDEQRAVGESTAHPELHQALQAVARERAHGARDSDYQELQSISVPQRRRATGICQNHGTANKKLLEQSPDATG